jgi:hypothetical protein
MRPGGEVRLSGSAGGYVWTGTLSNVPVNFPPADEGYFVRVFDPYLRDTPTAGVSGQRIRVGGQTLTVLSDIATPVESAWVYVDGSGTGHNPF